jgi:hypothetical protein
MPYGNTQSIRFGTQMSLKGLKFRLVQQFIYVKKGLIWNVSEKAFDHKNCDKSAASCQRVAHTGNCAALQFVHALS